MTTRLRTLGEGAPLVMLCGTGGRGSVFLPLARRLRKSFRCLMPDPTPPFETEQAASLLLARLANEGISSFHVLGVSLGGCTAQWVAALAPERVLSLTLCAAFATLDTPTREVISALRHARLTQPEAIFLPQWMTALYGYDAPPTLVTMDIPPEPFAAQLDAALAHDGTPLLPAIHCPTRVTFGTDDRLIPPGLSIALAEGIASAETEAFPGGHMHWMQAFS